MAKKQTYEELEQRVKELETLEAERKENEVGLERLFNLSVDMLCIADMDAYFRHINESFEKTLGYTKEELLKKSFIHFIHPDDIASTMAEVEKLSRGEPTIYFENRYRCKDGSYKWLGWTSMPDPEKGLMYAIARDITNSRRMEEALQKAHDELEQNVKERTAELTKANKQMKQEIEERKRAEEALRESEERYRTLVDNLDFGITLIDTNHKIVITNIAYSRNFNKPASEFVGKNCFTEFEKRKEVCPHCPGTRAMATGHSAEVEAEGVRDDGSRFPVRVEAFPFFGSNGKVMGFIEVAKDITEQRLVEEEKQKLEAQLQQAQRMESIGTLAGGLAHNFNNLLMSIIGNASIMLFDVDPSHPHYQNLKNIEKNVQSGSKLTKQLLGYAREGRYDVKPISLNQLVKETSDTFNETRKEIEVHQELAEKLYGIEADQGQIEQVLLNLYVNAADAMPNGGELFLKTMNITNEDMKDKPYEPKPGNYVLLTIRDTGVGMDKETMERIFDPFFTTKGLAQGTGLGLASTYGIIKAHGGYIDVESEKGQGTTFSIYLSATDKKVEEEKELSGEIMKGKETVLLVDDEEMVLDAGEKMLKKLGYEVLLASGGQEALELYEKNQDRIDMVLLDMVMPGVSGGETYDRMREVNPQVKVLLSSGYSINGQAKEILKRGCDAFIQKPFSMKELSQSIREILDKE